MNLVFLAQRIREFRKNRMLTLEQLAERSQLTQSVLSKVENSRVTPSLAALGRIAEALGISLSELVAGIDDERRITVVRQSERQIVDRDNSSSSFVYRSLALTRHTKRMEPLMVELPVGSVREESFSHGGEEFILVVKGTVEIDCGNEHFLLEVGDSVYLDAGEKHRVANAGQSVAEILSVLSGDGHLPAPPAENGKEKA